MPSLLQMLKARFERRQSQNLSECLYLWYQTSMEVSEICGEALYEQVVIQGDIGVLLDRVDRKLFQYRNDASDAKRQVGKYNKDLASRVSTITGQLYELRNQTASVLIRSQGPSPFAAPPDDNRQDEYDQRALIESGLRAREYKATLDKDIRAIWMELEDIIALVENET
jgi:hypothetical protein